MNTQSNYHCVCKSEMYVGKRLLCQEKEPFDVTFWTYLYTLGFLPIEERELLKYIVKCYEHVLHA